MEKQRIIKFRVWNKIYVEMFYPEETLPKDSQRIKEYLYLYLNGELRGNFKVCGDVNCDEECILQQFIGLKDKNEKEIYEGDILTVYENQMALEKIKDNFVVAWNTEDKPEFCLQDIKSRQFLGHTGWRLTKERSDFYEIIGNIFENPELLM